MHGVLTAAVWHVTFSLLLQGKIGEVDHVLQTLTQVEEEWQQEDHNRSYY
jgi:hypothetical protein